MTNKQNKQIREAAELPVGSAPDLAERILKAAQLAQPIFAAHGWKWGCSWRPLLPGERYDVPTVEQIADTLKRLYDQSLVNESGCCASGRLSVYVDDDDGSIAVDVQLADLRDEIPDWYETRSRHSLSPDSATAEQSSPSSSSGGGG